MISYIKKLFSMFQKQNNAVQVIFPRKLYNSVWVFDDAKRNLIAEPFVAGANTAIDFLTHAAGIKNAEKGFALYFSDKPLKKNLMSLTFVQHQGGWTDYMLDGTDVQVPLCPVMLMFFQNPPDKLYAYAEALKQ